MIIFFVLYVSVCETWCLPLREECTLRVLESRVLRRAFGPKSVEVTGDERKLYEEELHELYSCGGDQIQMDEM
jgi:hypothetical protein